MLTPPAALGTSLKNKRNNKKKKTDPKLRKIASDKLVHKCKNTSYRMIK